MAPPFLCGSPPMHNTHTPNVRTESRDSNRVNVNFSYRPARENTGDFCDNCLICLCIFHKAKLELQNNCIIIKRCMIKKHRGSRGIVRRLKPILSKCVQVKECRIDICKIESLCYNRFFFSFIELTSFYKQIIPDI